MASQDGFTGTVTLSCPTTYGAGSCSITPASVSSFPATLTLTINGTSFSAGDYTVSGAQTLSGTPGGQATAKLQLTSVHSYAGKINATCDVSSLPGAMCSLTPGNPITLSTGGSASLNATINIPDNASAGVYSAKINVQDTTGAPSHSATVSLTVAQDFLVTSSTSSQTVTAGQTSGPYALTVQPVGSSFSGAVTLACTSGLPAGAQCVFNPAAPVTPGNSAVDVVMNISTASNARSRVMGEKGSVPPPAIWLPLQQAC